MATKKKTAKKIAKKTAKKVTKKKSVKKSPKKSSKWQIASQRQVASKVFFDDKCSARHHQQRHRGHAGNFQYFPKY